MDFVVIATKMPLHRIESHRHLSSPSLATEEEADRGARLEDGSGVFAGWLEDGGAGEVEAGPRGGTLLTRVEDLPPLRLAGEGSSRGRRLAGELDRPATPLAGRGSAAAGARPGRRGSEERGSAG
jgi:hypothetical protein